ncbi:MAG: efflux RND transporter permease subunit, partial [Candidatus Eisenbacteria bacterium]|nr:efflux RND transporter permease subunit [Candidatus Eisenbacteria bacterium]
KPLEATLSTTENLTRMETEVEEGRVAINLHFSYGTNIDFALQDASKNLDRARANLPEEADPPTIFKFDPSQIPVYEVAFSSATRDLIFLRDWAEFRLRPQLLTVEGIASVDVSGGLTREIQVILDQERLRSYGLTVSQVTDALREANQDVAAGRVSSPRREVVGKTAGKFRNVEDVRTVLLTLPGGRHVPLSEVAEILDTNREQRLWARLNGSPAVKISIRKQPNANTVKVADQIDARLHELASTGFIPSDVAYETIQNQADFIRGSVSAVRNAALLGALLAMFVVLIFLGSLRKTFVIGLAIPLAVLATFVMMGLSHLTLNIMSLGGLALGVGLLIDNSIVMLENIFRHKEEGNEDPEEAALEGSAEVQSAVTASTVTNLAAVVPFLLISGLAALIFRELILTISFAILASLLVALTVVPMLAAQLAKIRFTSHLTGFGPIAAFDRGLGKVRSAYVRSATAWVVKGRWAVLGIAVLALVGSLFATRRLGNEFLPQVDDGNVSISISLPPGASAEETNRLTQEVEGMVTQMPDVLGIFATAGGRFFGSGVRESAGTGSIDVVLAPRGDRTMTSDAWVRSMQAKIQQRGFPGARISVRPPRIRGLRTSASGSAVALDVQGDDLGELQRIATDLMVRLQDVPGLENLEPSAEEASPELTIELDRERAAYLGLSVAAVGQTIRTALDGSVPTRFSAGNQEYDLRVMFPRDRFTSPEELGSIALFPGSAEGAPIYLRDVAKVNNTLGPTTIRRENQNRVLQLTGDVISEVASVGEVNDEIRRRLARLDLPDGYAVLIGGEQEAIEENNRQLAIVVALAIFLVFVVLAVQYESVVNPLVIILAIPLSLIGVGLLLALTGTSLSAPVLLGVILLAGIVVNNAILLVHQALTYMREDGMSPREAVVASVRTRTRPIFMSSLTSVFGMLPLVLMTGAGSELYRGIGSVVVGGLTVSTLFTLVVVPAMFSLFIDARAWLM